MNKLKLSISNILILVSVLITGLENPFPWLFNYGMNNYYLMVAEDYIGVIIQFCLYQFLHGGLFHILANSLFIFIFGNQVELMLGKGKYMLFFIGNTVFTGILLLFLASGNTIGISGFAMAILGYVFMALKSINHPDYKGAGIFIILNILIGFSSQISLIGHLGGAIFGIIFFYILNNPLKKIK